MVNETIASTALKGGASIFSGFHIGSLVLVLGIAFVIYLWLWFYNTEMALRITWGIGQLIVILVKGVFIVVSNVISWLVGLVAGRRR